MKRCDVCYSAMEERELFRTFYWFCPRCEGGKEETPPDLNNNDDEYWFKYQPATSPGSASGDSAAITFRRIGDSVTVTSGSNPPPDTL